MAYISGTYRVIAKGSGEYIRFIEDINTEEEARALANAEYRKPHVKHVEIIRCCFKNKRRASQTIAEAAKPTMNVKFCWRSSEKIWEVFGRNIDEITAKCHDLCDKYNAIHFEIQLQ